MRKAEDSNPNALSERPDRFQDEAKPELGLPSNTVGQRLRAIATYNLKPNVCRECRQPIVVRLHERVTVVRKKAFCNRSCAARFNNVEYPKRAPSPSKRKPSPKKRRSRTAKSLCPTCGRKFRGRNKYCSSSCTPSRAQAYQVYVEAWLAGDVNGGRRGFTVSRHVRRYLFEKHDSKCARCGWSERNPTSGSIPLHVDHIDGDWRNNRPSNLTLLCPNCHALTPTYGNLNKGRGRPVVLHRRDV